MASLWQTKVNRDHRRECSLAVVDELFVALGNLICLDPQFVARFSRAAGSFGESLDLGWIVDFRQVRTPSGPLLKRECVIHI